MSEQLTLGGFGDAGATQNKKKKSKSLPSKKGVEIDADIQARVQKLLDEKAEKILNSVAAAPVESIVVPVEVVEDPEIVEEVAIQNPEPEILSISQLNKNIKQILEKSFPLIWVKGEISNFKIPSSGHMYFTLKDSGAQIKAVMFRGFNQSLKFEPEDGMEVLVRCRVTVYEPRGDYQLFCEVMEPVGYGALQVAFEKLKQKLQAEGLFDTARKRPMPSFPQRIAIVTSPTGAAIRDMINVLTRRFGGTLDITVIPTPVQGDKAPPEIAKAIRLVSKMGPSRFDVVIVGRGGGSLEDLWAFNTEEVARAVSECRIPTISAVGHEVDFTICDFVADLRAPTPSAAAELVVKNKADLAERVKIFARQLTQSMLKKIQMAIAATEASSKRLIDPKRRLQDLMLRCDEWTDRLVKGMDRFMTDSATEIRFLTERLGSPEGRLESFRQKIQILNERVKAAVLGNLQVGQNRFARLAATLDGLSPLAVLERGYSIVKAKGTIVKNSSELKKGEKIEIRLAKGDINAEVL